MLRCFATICQILALFVSMTSVELSVTGHVSIVKYSVVFYGIQALVSTLFSLSLSCIYDSFALLALA